MQIAVLGPFGSVGSPVVVRRTEQIAQAPPDAVPHIADATDTAAMTEVAYHHDVLIGATRPPAGREAELVTAAKSMLDGAAAAEARLLLIGGAGTLEVPGSGGRTVLDDERYLSPAARPIALACGKQLDACRAHPTADWTNLCPAAALRPGDRTGLYRHGTDQLVVDEDGRSLISMEDLAVAAIDELERPLYRRQRFTVAY